MAREDHVHIYVRHPKDKSKYKCDDPDCYVIMDKSTIEGKRAVCSVCRENEIILSKEDLRRTRPRCLQCSNTKQAKAFREKENYVSALFGNLELGKGGEKNEDRSNINL